MNSSELLERIAAALLKGGLYEQVCALDSLWSKCGLGLVSWLLLLNPLLLWGSCGAGSTRESIAT